MHFITNKRLASTMWRNFGIPVLLVGLTVILKLLLVHSFIEVGNSFLLFFTTVVLATHLGGKQTGLVTVGLSALINLYIFIPPVYSLSFKHPGDVVRLIIFIVEAAFASQLTWRLRAALHRTEVLAQESLQHQKFLRRSEERFCQMTDVMRDVFWMKDVESDQILYVSPSFEQVWGYPCQSVYADIRVWVDSIYPDDHDRVKQIFFTDHFSGCEVEYRIVRADGVVRWIRDRALPIQNAKGQTYRITGLAEDITERKEMEVKLQSAYADLEQRVRDRTQELSDVNGLLFRRIAAHQATEHALQSSEEQLQMALEASGDGLWDWNIKTGDDYFSPQWLGMLGYEVGDLPSDVSSWEALVHPGDKPWVINLLENHMRDGDYPYKFDYRMLTKSGEWKWVSNYGKVVSRDRDGVPTRMVGIHRDIHAQKVAQEALVKSEKRLQYLVSASPAIIFSCQPNCGFKTTYISENVTDIWGYQANEFLTNTSFWLDHVHPEDLESVFAKAQELVPNELNSCEYRFLHQDGSYRWMWAKLRPMLNELSGEIEVLGSLIDISDRVKLEQERKQAIQALEESEATLRSFYDSSTMMMGIVELKADEIFHISANRSAAAALGRSLEELKDLPAISEGRSPGFDPMWINHFRESGQQGNPVQFECAEETSTGPRWLSCTVCPIHPSSDLRSRFSYIVEDITARKTAEAKIATSLHEKEILLKEIHHRVKNNLQIICSLLGLQSQFSKDDRNTVSALQDSQNRVQSMALVHETLYQSATFSKINMAYYVKTLTCHLSRSYWCLDSQVELSTYINPEIFLDLNTAVPLGLIINELVSNALKHAFTGQSGGKIDIQMLSDTERTLCLNVNDDGQGLPVDFDLGQSQTLGLTLVQDLVNQIAGELAIKSSIGTQFTVTFPHP